jgi:hypothetical protein
MGISSQNGTLIRKIHTVIGNPPTLIGRANFLLSSSFILTLQMPAIPTGTAGYIRKNE